MKLVFGKIVIMVGMLGFGASGILLLMGHSGYASNIVGYNYGLILVGVIYELFIYEK